MTALRLCRADPADCLRWDAALRVGRRVVWAGPVPQGWSAAEVGALVDDGPKEVVRWAPANPSVPAAAGLVTVVIPTHRWVPWGLRMLAQQTWPTRVLVVSNGAGPTALPGVEVWRTPWLGHAGTRRAALARVRTPYVLMMSDDAIPRGRGFVATLVRTLNKGVDAVVARQVAWPTANATVRAKLRSWTPASPGPMPHADHVATLYRTDDLCQWATEDVPIAEDLAWTRHRRVVRAPDAVVLHSHVPSVRALLQRRRAEHAVRRQLGMSVPVPGFRAAFSAVPGALVGGPPAELAHRLAEVFGMAWGAHEGR